MLDEELRRSIKPLYGSAAKTLARLGFTNEAVTGAGLGIGMVCLVAVAFGLNLIGLVLWLANRLFDGEVAHLRGEDSEYGAILDITADFFLYGGLLIALAVQHPEASLAHTALFFAYYLNGSFFLALSVILEKTKAERHIERDSTSAAR